MWYYLCKDNQIYSEFLQLFIKYGDCNVNIVFSNHSNENAMLLASKTNNLSMMKLLTKHGFDYMSLVNETTSDEYKETVFLRLCENGTVDSLAYLMNAYNGINIFAKDSKTKKNGLHIAIEQQNYQVVEYLLENVFFPKFRTKSILNANNTNFIQQTDRYGNTPAHYACIGSIEADIITTLNNDNSATAALIQNFSNESVQSNADSINEDETDAEQTALTILILLVKYGADLNVTNDGGRLPLHFACENDHSMIVNHILENNLCLNINHVATDREETETPLMTAIYHNSVDCVKVMLNGSKDLLFDSTTGQLALEYNYTPWQTAAFYGHTEILKLLIAAVFEELNVNDWKSFEQKGRSWIDFESLRQIANDGLTFRLARNRTTSEQNSGNIHSYSRSRSRRNSRTSRHSRNPSKSKKINDDNCSMMLGELIREGINGQHFDFIAIKLNYKVKKIMMKQLMPKNNSDYLSSGQISSKPRVSHTYMTSLNYDNDNFTDMTDDEKEVKETIDKLASSNDDKLMKRQVGDWYIGQQIGNGGFGVVNKGINLKTSQKVALKFIQRSKNKYENKLIIGEIESLKKLKHKNIIKLLAYNLNVDASESKYSGNVMLVFEYVANGELFHLLSVSNYFDIKIAKTYFEQIIDALRECHKLNIIHRDLKPQNLLIDSQFQLKIADFGLCKIFDHTENVHPLNRKGLKQNSSYSYTNNKSMMVPRQWSDDSDNGESQAYVVGTRGYMAPEILSPQIKKGKSNGDTEKRACDIFSTGIILWQMVNGINSMPFREAVPKNENYFLIYTKQYNTFWNVKHADCQINAQIKNSELFNGCNGNGNSNGHDSPNSGIKWASNSIDRAMEIGNNEMLINGIDGNEMKMGVNGDVINGNGNGDSGVGVNGCCGDNIESYLLLKDLFNQMFEYNPSKRINIQQIINHDWFKITPSYNDVRKQQMFYNIMNDKYKIVKEKYTTLQSDHAISLMKSRIQVCFFVVLFCFCVGVSALIRILM